jgi:putative hydroxymethylpyrimidine transport system permease protein
MAAAVAPIGAIIGEWVSSAEGQHVMLNATARLQTDLLCGPVYFAATDGPARLAVDALHRLIDWTPE